jgi:hypothetical protein
MVDFNTLLERKGKKLGSKVWLCNRCMWWVGGLKMSYLNTNLKFNPKSI